MATAAITSWLANGCNYGEGLILLKQYSTNEFLLYLLDKGESDYNRVTLYDELQKINSAANKSPLAKQSLPEPDDFARPNSSHPPINTEDLPAELQQRVRRKNLLHKQRSYLHSQLLYLEDNVSRREASIKIVKASEEIAQIWKAIDTWRNDGSIIKSKESKRKIPDTIDGLTPLELHYLIHNNISYISKLRKKINNSSGRKKQEYEMQLEKRQALINLARNELSDD